MPDGNEPRISVVLPCKNEAAGLGALIDQIQTKVSQAEVLLVDDGSTDGSGDIAEQHGARCIRHPYSKGNGAAVKSGARAAKGEIIVFMDADGQHNPDDISRLVSRIDAGYDLVIGARDRASHASRARAWANAWFNASATLMSGYRIEDLTSGFRAVRASNFRRFLYLLPNGFSYPTTSTMAFYRAGFSVGFEPIRARKRAGKSHVLPLRDGSRFVMIILKIGTLFAPMRLFLPIAASLFVTGAGYYAYTYAVMTRFTNMSAVLFLSALFVLLIGLVSEQVSSLHYRGIDDQER